MGRAGLLDGLGQATFEEIRAVLAEREPVQPELGLDAAAMQRRERIALDRGHTPGT